MSWLAALGLVLLGAFIAFALMWWVGGGFVMPERQNVLETYHSDVEP